MVRIEKEAPLYSLDNLFVFKSLPQLYLCVKPYNRANYNPVYDELEQLDKNIVADIFILFYKGLFVFNGFAKIVIQFILVVEYLFHTSSFTLVMECSITSHSFFVNNALITTGKYETQYMGLYKTDFILFHFVILINALAM